MTQLISKRISNFFVLQIIFFLAVATYRKIEIEDYDLVVLRPTELYSDVPSFIQDMGALYTYILFISKLLLYKTRNP